MQILIKNTTAQISSEISYVKLSSQTSPQIPPSYLRSQPDFPIFPFSNFPAGEWENEKMGKSGPIFPFSHFPAGKCENGKEFYN